MSRPVTLLFVSIAALACGAPVAVAASAPAASTGKASAAPQTATVSGTINPHGVPTAFYFRVGLTKAYGRARLRPMPAPAPPAGSSRRP